MYKSKPCYSCLTLFLPSAGSRPNDFGYWTAIEQYAVRLHASYWAAIAVRHCMIRLREKMNSRTLVLFALVWIPVTSILACNGVSQTTPIPQETPISTVVVDRADRETRIPANAVKMSPGADEHPPLLHSSDYEQPVPVPGSVNTAGAEDSPFIAPDGRTLYFFFTPDVKVPVEQQILDGVTGIYVSRKLDSDWSKPERVILQDSGKLAGDGCEFVLGDVMWFCSVREGYTGVHWFTAEYGNGTWQDWKVADFDPEYQVGELHITSDGTELYFGADRPGGKGKLDIWVSKRINGKWQEPVDVAVVNTVDSEGWPAISPDGDELWFTRNHGVWRSRRMNGEWQEAEQIVSSLAGEPSIDDAGNVYFVHHFYKNDVMIEADIYVAYRKSKP